MHRDEFDTNADYPEDFKTFTTLLYILALVNPLLIWIFNFFLMFRVNAKTRVDENPKFLDAPSDLNSRDSELKR